ncbi:MAG: shikimate dehydrogenase [Candidatus Omnitrophota bacterium]
MKEKKKIYGLLGKGINYSLSPAMHNAAFKHFNISAEYRLFDISPDNLEQFLKDEVLSHKLSGINVTVPYKIKVKELLISCCKDAEKVIQVDSFADDIGSINTVEIHNDTVSLYNTDGVGFYESIKEDLDFDPENKKIFILGAGGAGRVISTFLAAGSDERPANIFVYDIDEEKRSSLKEICRNKEGMMLIEIVENMEKLSEADLIVNATPFGTKQGDKMPLDPKIFKQGACVYDLIYARKTELVKEARKKGLKAVNGEGMLACQGAYAFHLWTERKYGLDEIEEIMKQALSDELKKGIWKRFKEFCKRFWSRFKEV